MASSDEANVERYRRVLALFRAARALPRKQRARWVQEAAQGDTLVEGELARRLAAWDRLNERRDLGVEFDSYYELLKRLGRGGMGAVFLARQVRLDRFEAVKKINPDFAADADAVRMFAAEARAAAALRHGGIVQIYAVGSHGGQPAYAMEYLSGGTLQERLAREAIAPREAAELVAQIADAVDYAHQCGIIHRDLKPANILLDSEGRPKVVDFGLARGPHFQHDVLTGVAGTPAYMSPEQAASAEVGPASDVHALGAVLYALLTGEPPFSGKDAGEVIEKVLHAPPPRPRRNDRRISRQLQKICLRCLEKEPERRYATAGEVAAVLRGWLARRRRLTRLGSGAVVLGMVAGLLALSGLRGREATSANLRAASERSERLKQESLVAENKRLAAARDLAARRNRYAAAMKLAQEALKSGDVGQVVRLLEEQRPPAGKEDLRGFEWHWLWRVCHREWRLLGRHGAAVRCVAWSSDGQTIVSGGADGVVRLWNAETRKPHGELGSSPDTPWRESRSPEGDRALRHGVSELPTAHTGAVLAAAFSADGKRVATSGEDGRARFWDVASRKMLAEFEGPGGPLGALAITADAARLAAGVRDDHFAPRICQWDVATRQRIDLPLAEMPVHALAFSPRGDLLAAGTGPCAKWDTACNVLLYSLADATPSPPIRLAGHQAAVTSVAFSGDGREILSGSRDGFVRVWNVAQRQELRQAYCQGPGERRILSIALSGDGAKLAAVGLDAAIHIWDVASLTEERLRIGHRDVVYAAAWAPHENTLVTSGDDGAVLLWDIPSRPSPEVFQADDHEVMGLAISPDGSSLATVGGALSKPGDVRLWSLPLVANAKPAVLESRQVRHYAAAYSPDGGTLAVAGGDWNKAGRIDLWDIPSASKRATYLLVDDATPAEWREQNEQRRFRTATCVAFSPDGRWIVAGGGNWGNDAQPSLARVWSADGQTRALLRNTAMVRSVAFSPRGEWLAFGGQDCPVAIYDTNQWQRREEIQIEPGHHVCSLVFSPDGAALAVSVSGNESNKAAHVYLYDVPTWRELMSLEGHTGLLRAVTFSPDGRRLATACYDHTTRLWDRATGHELARYNTADQGGASIAFSLDGRYLAAGLHQGSVHLWDIGAAQGLTAAADESPSPPKALLTGRRVASIAPLSKSPVAVSARGTAPVTGAATGPTDRPPALALSRGEAAPLTSVDRKAAEYALAIQGTVCVNHVARDIKAVAELPIGPFLLTTVVLENNQQVTDEGLACFEGTKDVIYLNLSGTPVSNAGFAHFRGCKKLRGFNLAGTKVTDAGMIYFKDCKDLRGISLARTQVSDTGLESFKHSDKVEYLYLGATRVTDAGLAHFGNSKGLLKHLYLSNTDITDAGLAIFKGCENLLALGLDGTHVTDAGLAPITAFVNLTYLGLRDTGVTSSKIEALRQALPSCKIEWSGKDP